MTISVDYNSMLSTVQSLIEGLWPVFMIPIGFGLAFAILGFMMEKIVSSIRGL